MIARHIVLWLVCLLVSTSALAQTTPPQASAEETARAHTHYDAGQAAYYRGDYETALREFTVGYELGRLPGFLYNIAQTYRKMGRLEEALDRYQQLLAIAPAESQEVLASAHEAVGQIRAEMAARALHQPKPFIRRHWWIIPVSVVVAGAAIGLGVYFGTRGSCSEPLGCVNVR